MSSKPPSLDMPIGTTTGETAATFGPWIFLTIVGGYLVWAAAYLVAAPKADEFNESWQLLGRWGLASHAHMSWSATILATVALALLAISFTAVHRRDDQPDPLPLLGMSANIISAALTVWLGMVALGIILDSDFEFANNAAGLFIVAPIGICAALAVGRYTLLSPTSLLRNKLRLRTQLIRNRAMYLMGLGSTQQKAWKQAQKDVASRDGLGVCTRIRRLLTQWWTQAVLVLVGTAVAWLFGYSFGEGAVVVLLLILAGCVAAGITQLRATAPGLRVSALTSSKTTLAPWGWAQAISLWIVLALISTVFVLAALARPEAMTPAEWVASTSLAVATWAAFLWSQFARKPRTTWLQRHLELTEDRILANRVETLQLRRSIKEDRRALKAEQALLKKPKNSTNASKSGKKAKG